MTPVSRRRARSSRRNSGTKFSGASATQLGVSSTPVRDAFQLIQAAGLVLDRPAPGAEVFRPTAAEVPEAYEIRKVIEAARSHDNPEGHCQHHRGTRRRAGFLRTR